MLTMAVATPEVQEAVTVVGVPVRKSRTAQSLMVQPGWAEEIGGNHTPP